MGGIITILVPFTIIFLIVLFVVGLRVKTEEGENDLLKNVYIYLVLFATLMMFIGGSIGAFMALADIVSPAPYHQSFEEYRMWDAPENEGETKSEEELRISYEAMIELDKENSTHRSINMLIKSFGWIIIPLPVFIYFQRRLNKTKSE